MYRPDTNEMVVFHRVFRREFRLAAELVRRTAAGDRKRAGVVAAHIEEYLGILHHHHTGEDRLLWPRLRARARMDVGTVDRMEKQHHAIAELVDAVQELLPKWRIDPEPAVTNRLAQLLDQLRSRTDEHLDDEEAHLLPLAAAHVSVAEWDQLAADGMAGVPRNRRLIILGSILEDADETERAKFLRKLPPPARLAYRVVGAAKYRKETTRIRAGVRP